MMDTQILDPSDRNLRLIAAHLHNGNVAGMPTETVYGLAANAFNVNAVIRIFETKERPKFDPLIVHISQPVDNKINIAYLEFLNLINPEKTDARTRKKTDTLIHTFWPGPLTIILPKNPAVPDILTSGLTTVAIRMPKHPVAQKLLKCFGGPLAAPSANRFGRTSPTTAQDVLSELGGRIEFILDGGKCDVGLESTIIHLGDDGNTYLLRPGVITKEEIEAVINEKLLYSDLSIAPGMLKSHYAPSKPFYMLPAIVDQLNDKQINNVLNKIHKKNIKLGLLAYSGDANSIAKKFKKITTLETNIAVLSETGDPKEAARNLFAFIRSLDQSDADILFTEPCPVSEGLGYAIQNRLRKAAND